MPNNNSTGVGGFKKGQSGNPGGLRNKHIGDLSREARRYAAGLALFETSDAARIVVWHRYSSFDLLSG